MKWSAFKQSVEAQGVKDGDDMSWIDWQAGGMPLVRRFRGEGAVMVSTGTAPPDPPSGESVAAHPADDPKSGRTLGGIILPASSTSRLAPGQLSMTTDPIGRR